MARRDRRPAWAAWYAWNRNEPRREPDGRWLVRKSPDGTPIYDPDVCPECQAEIDPYDTYCLYCDALTCTGELRLRELRRQGKIPSRSAQRRKARGAS